MDTTHWGTVFCYPLWVHFGVVCDKVISEIGSKPIFEGGQNLNFFESLKVAKKMFTDWPHKVEIDFQWSAESVFTHFLFTFVKKKHTNHADPVRFLGPACNRFFIEKAINIVNLNEPSMSVFKPLKIMTFFQFNIDEVKIYDPRVVTPYRSFWNVEIHHHFHHFGGVTLSPSQIAMNSHSVGKYWLHANSRWGEGQRDFVTHIPFWWTVVRKRYRTTFPDCTRARPESFRPVLSAFMHPKLPRTPHLKISVNLKVKTKSECHLRPAGRNFKAFNFLLLKGRLMNIDGDSSSLPHKNAVISSNC